MKAVYDLVFLFRRDKIVNDEVPVKRCYIKKNSEAKIVFHTGVYVLSYAYSLAGCICL